MADDLSSSIRDLELARRKHASPLRKALRSASRNPALIIGATVVTLLILVAIGATQVAPYDPLEMHMKSRLQSPGPGFVLGTDEFGRDLLSRIIQGTRYSLIVSAAVVALGGVLGAVFGLLGGYFGGWADELVMRVSDIILAFPAMLLAIAIIAIIGTGATQLIWALVLVYIPVFARMVRSSTLSIREELFVEAARSIGAREARIAFRHVLPNVAPVLVFQFTLSLSNVLLTEAALSFLGLGAQPPDPSWGVMLSESRRFMEFAPWMAIYPGLAIAVAVLGFNLLGDGLQDVIRH